MPLRVAAPVLRKVHSTGTPAIEKDGEQRQSAEKKPQRRHSSDSPGPVQSSRKQFTCITALLLFVCSRMEAGMSGPRSFSFTDERSRRNSCAHPS